MKFTYEIDTNEEYFGEPEDYLKILLMEDVVFINNGWWDKNWPEDHITIHVNCNDVFAWGAADGEGVLFSELKDLFEMYIKDPIWGPTVFCIKKRKQRPQPSVEKRIKELGIWDLEEILK